MRLSSKDREILSNIYSESVLVEMDVDSVMGGSPTSGGELVNGDNYAPGDTRIPKVLGDVQTRKGKAKKCKCKGKCKCKVGTKSASPRKS